MFELLINFCFLIENKNRILISSIQLNHFNLDIDVYSETILMKSIIQI